MTDLEAGALKDAERLLEMDRVVEPVDVVDFERGGDRLDVVEVVLVLERVDEVVGLVD